MLKYVFFLGFFCCFINQPTFAVYDNFKVECLEENDETIRKIVRKLKNPAESLEGWRIDHTKTEYMSNIAETLTIKQPVSEGIDSPGLLQKITKIQIKTPPLINKALIRSPAGKIKIEKMDSETIRCEIIRGVLDGPFYKKTVYFLQEPNS